MNINLLYARHNSNISKVKLTIHILLVDNPLLLCVPYYTEHEYMTIDNYVARHQES